jgi:hypothetical protein
VISCCLSSSSKIPIRVDGEISSFFEISSVLIAFSS